MGFLSSLFGVGSSSKPATTTNVVQQQLPKEISPFVTEIAKEAQDLFKERVAEGYTPYTGQTIAPLTPQEEAAMAGIEGLVGTSRPLQEEALGVTRQQAERFTPETAQAYMSPYQRAVTDIEKREAGRQFDVAQQVRDAQAAGAGASSLMGTRAAILDAEAQRNQQQLLADIEAKGLQSAYQDAQRAFETQKARERQMAGDIAKTGPAMLASGIQEQGALQRIGEERRALGQSALDEAYFKFLEERQFPEQTLADYSGFIYGNPMARLANTTTTGTSTPFQPSLGQTLLGIGSTLGAAALRNPNITSRVFTKEGGQIDRNRGLSGLPMFRRQAGTQVVSDEELEMIDQEGVPEKVKIVDTAETIPNNIVDPDVQADAERIVKLLGKGKITLPGEESLEAGQKRLAEEKQSRINLYNKFFPQESEYSFAADALQAFGAMIVSGGNKAETFNKEFNRLQKEGLNKRQARRLANYKIGLDSLDKEEALKKFDRERPARVSKMLQAAKDRKLERQVKKSQIEKNLRGTPSKRKAVAVETSSPEFDIYSKQIELLGKSYEKIDPKIGKHLQDLDDRTLQILISRALNYKAELGDRISPDQAIHKVVTDAIRRYEKTGGKELGREGWFDTIIQEIFD